MLKKRHLQLSIIIFSFFILVVITHYFINQKASLPSYVGKTSSENHLAKLPDFSKFTDVKEKKVQFFDTLYPIIEEENSNVLKARARIVALMNYKDLNEVQTNWLYKTAQYYRVEAQTIDDRFFELLLKKVDYIPPSLALTQAAIESGWGTSRFSKQGNNLFGQWCFKIGCGMVPASRDAGKTHEVASFETVNLAVRAYIKNLNTNQSYAGLREQRAQMRQQDTTLTGVALAKTLDKYSEEGNVYIDKVIKFIDYNDLANFTEHFESTNVYLQGNHS